MALGEAAGLGAAASLAHGGETRAVPLPALQRSLEKHGAILAPTAG